MQSDPPGRGCVRCSPERRAPAILIERLTRWQGKSVRRVAAESALRRLRWRRSEEHTSELQSRPHLVCRLLLEKKKISRAVDNLAVYPLELGNSSVTTRAYRFP